MSLAVIIDAIVAVILLLFVFFGARRGLFRALAGLLILVIALIGAGFAANKMSEPVSKMLSPMVEEKIVKKIEEAVEDIDLRQIDSDTFGELMERIGLDETARLDLQERTQEKLEGTATAASVAVAEELTHSLAYGIVYILTFFLLLVLLHLAANAVDLFLRLPVLHGANALCGAAVGAVEGMLFLFLAIWVARKLGCSFLTLEAVSQTYLLKFFMTNTPLSVLSFL